MIINYETAFENNFINSTPSAQRNELDIINSDMDRKKAKKVQEAARARKKQAETEQLMHAQAGMAETLGEVHAATRVGTRSGGAGH